MSKSIINGDQDGRCFICQMMQEMGKEVPKAWGTDSIEVHHIFGGPLRSKSEHYGLKVHICAFHHRISPFAVHGAFSNGHESLNWQLKMIGQKEYEKHYGHGSWMQEFGKNYLPEDQWEL